MRFVSRDESFKSDGYTMLFESMPMAALGGGEGEVIDVMCDMITKR